MSVAIMLVLFFFFNDTATTEIYTLSLHDALPIFHPPGHARGPGRTEALCAGLGVLPALHRTRAPQGRLRRGTKGRLDRKSTRLNSSHANISYAVFCLKKKKKNVYDSLCPLTVNQT